MTLCMQLPTLCMQLPTCSNTSILSLDIEVHQHSDNRGDPLLPFHGLLFQLRFCIIIDMIGYTTALDKPFVEQETALWVQ